MSSDSVSPISLPGEGNLLHDCMGSWRLDETCLITWTPAADPEFESFSFEAFQESSQRAAGWLDEGGLGERDVVILLIRDPALLMVTFWGAVVRGAVPAILAYPNFKMNRPKYASGLRGVSNQTGARLVVIDSGFPAEFQEMIHLPAGSALREISRASIERAPPLRVSPKITPDSPVLLQHSAGTTGLQKGVVLNHRQVLRQIRKLARYLELNLTDRFASWLPLYHDMGLIACFLLPAVAGLPIVVQSPDDWVLRPVSFLQIVTRFRATRSWLPNFAFSFLSRSVPSTDRIGLDLSSVRSLVNCSEPVTAAAMDSFYDAFKDYGLSASALETSYALAENVFAVTHSIRDRPSTRLAVDSDSLAVEDTVRKVSGSGGRVLTLISSGICLEGTEVKICGRSGSRLPEPGIGELWIRSDCLFGGYFGSSDRGNCIEKGWFKTGDFGFFHDNELFVLGRLDDVIIAGGRNIHPVDIEDLASQHPAIHAGRVVAFGVRNLRSGTQDLVVVAEVNTDGELSEADSIEADLRVQIVAHLGFSPRTVQVVEPGWMVKSTAGKPARRASRTRFFEQNADLAREHRWSTDPWNN